MREMLRCLSSVAVGVSVSAAALVSAAQAGDCRNDAIASLRALSPDGTAVYERVGDKGFFRQWITCDDVQLGLATAVHESVHSITAHTDAFPLVGGGEVKLPHAVSAFFAPSRIARHFGRSDFVTTYLRPGQASSSTDFLYLLDELNAYTHDLNAAMDLRSLKPADERVGHRDGLAATMAFVADYAATARQREPDTWAGLQRPEVAGAVSELWTRAERVMAASCGIPDFGLDDKAFLRRLCEPAAQSAMEGLLGRAPVCPSRCLQADAPTEDASAGDVAE